MADSLILGGAIELLGQAPSAIPACAGVIFSLAPGHDLSAPATSSDVVVALNLDGQRPVPGPAGNRAPVLPIVLHLPPNQPSNQAARLLLAGAREVLARLVEQETFLLQWTRDGGLPLVLDCFKASTLDVDWSIVRDKVLQSSLTVNCSAQPFGRSDVPTLVDFPSPVAGRTAPATPVTIDGFTSVAGNPAWVVSALGPGPSSAYWTSGSARGTASFTKAGLGPFNLTGLAGLTVAAGFGSANFYPFFGLRRGGPVRFTFTLRDGTGKAVTRHVTRRVYLSNNAVGPIWQKVRLPLPVATGGFDYTNVTGYTITVSNEVPGSLAYTDVYLDSFTAVPVPVAGAATPTMGVVYDLAGIDGSARSPLSLQVQQPPGSSQQVTKLTTTVGPFSMLIPAECTVIQAAGSLGPGGKGARSTSSGGYAGAPAGEGSWEFGLPVTPGTVITGNIPHGGQSNTGAAADTTLVIAGITITGHGASNRADGVTGALAGTGTATYAPVQKLTGDASTFDAGLANWVAGANSAIVRTTVNPRSGAGALQLTSSAAGDMTAASCAAGSILTQGIGTWGLSTVPLQGFARAVTTGRSFQVGAEFYDVNGNTLGSLFGSSASDVTTGYTAAAATSLTAPAGARWLRYLVKVLATGAGGEVHKFDDLTIQTGQSWAGGSGAAISGSTSGGGGGVGGNTGAGGNGAAPAGGAAGSGSPTSGKGGTGRTNATFGQGAAGGTPGGGGAGAQAGIVAQILDGGKGGDGGISLAFQQRPAFKTLVLHRPGFDMPDTFCPFVQVPATDVPDGTTEYLLPQLVPGSNARFGLTGKPATFTVYAVSAGWNNPSAQRVVTVNVNHYEQNGGSVYATPIQRTVTPNTDLAFQGTSTASPLCRMGEITLPDHAMPDDNTDAYFTATITSTNLADDFQEILFLHTGGSSVVIESPVAYSTYWVDEPPADVEVGNILGSQFDRGSAVSVLAYATVSGPPLHMDPLGNQSLLVYTADAGMVAPSALATYWPRWLLERLS